VYKIKIFGEKNQNFWYKKKFGAKKQKFWCKKTIFAVNGVQFLVKTAYKIFRTLTLVINNNISPATPTTIIVG